MGHLFQRSTVHAIKIVPVLLHTDQHREEQFHQQELTCRDVTLRATHPPGHPIKTGLWLHGKSATAPGGRN